MFFKEKKKIPFLKTKNTHWRQMTEATDKVYTLEEVAKHKKAKVFSLFLFVSLSRSLFARTVGLLLKVDCIRVVTVSDECFEGGIFDITRWIPDHPGGSLILKEHAGTDITEATNVLI